MPGAREGTRDGDREPGAGRAQVRTFAARLERLPDLVAFVEAVAAVARLDRADALRLTLVVEELFANTIRHGHGGDSDQAVRVACEPRFGEVVLTYEDAAPPFDPVARIRATPGGAGPPAEAGGLGLLLIGALTAELAYVRAGGRNRLWLRFRGRFTTPPG
jgi:anti-sigma regulatory factor (Ser/Thr protein kinase)